MTWLSLAAAFAVLLGSFGYARHRAGERAAPANRTDRVWHSACLYGAAAALTDAIAPASQGQLVGAVLAAVPGFFLTAGASLLWAFAADLALIRLGAVRSRRWLIAAPPAFILACFALLVLPFAWWRGALGLVFAGLAPLATAADAAAAGLLWWSYLAPDERGVGRVFD